MLGVLDSLEVCHLGQRKETHIAVTDRPISQPFPWALLAALALRPPTHGQLVLGGRFPRQQKTDSRNTLEIPG